MSSNKDFVRKRRWDNYTEEVQDFVKKMTDTASMSDEEYEAYKMAINLFGRRWMIFETVRPVTAYLLKELFGDDARDYITKIEKTFTEEKAVKMVEFVKTIEKPPSGGPTKKRLSALFSSHFEEE
jgi:hypothetical protein|tara:strand:- start:148 stop:522 length:375 start_codon:yes stop_codon:yes gene_type:complete